jgi:hypothetical protein
MEGKWEKDDGGPTDIVETWDASDGMDDPAWDPSPDTVDAYDDPPLEPDAATTCTPADLVPQAMCGPGLKCTFRELDGSAVPVTFCDVEGSRGWNETCAATATSDNCGAGYYCVDWSGDRRCRLFCDADATCTVPPGGAHAACRNWVDVAGTPAAGVRVCSFSCDMLASPTGCDYGQSCKGLKDGSFWYTDCLPPGSGDRCLSEWFEDCPDGSGCFRIEHTYNECLIYCRLPSGSPACPSGTCHDIADWPSWVGACL